MVKFDDCNTTRPLGDVFSYQPQVIAIGVVFNPKKDQVYITQRLPHCDEANLWEFPGGKVEEGETVIEALCRELHEELDIIIDDSTIKNSITKEAISHFMTLDVSHKNLQLAIYKVYHYQGEPKPQQAAQGRWVKLDALSSYPFPKSNEIIIQKLCALTTFNN